MDDPFSFFSTTTDLYCPITDTSTTSYSTTYAVNNMSEGTNISNTATTAASGTQPSDFSAWIGRKYNEFAKNHASAIPDLAEALWEGSENDRAQYTAYKASRAASSQGEMTAEGSQSENK